MGKIGIASNKKLLDLFNMMKDDSLVLQPSFQRKLVWNNKHIESFIETILLGLPFPEIYFADGEINLEKQTSKTLVVDGQQRLSTIYRYITSSSDLELEKIKKFEDLTPEEQTNFFDYQIVIRELGRISEGQIRDIFKRINSVNYALNAVEISNALYEGEFINTAKLILQKNESLFKEDNVFESVFSAGEVSRMKDLEYMLLMMSTVEEKGYFISDKEVETYVIRYDSNYPNKDAIIADFYEVFSLIVSCKLRPDSLWNKRSSFFTLAVELVKFKRKHSSIPQAENLRNLLNSLESTLDENKNKDTKSNKYSQYYYYTHQGTTSKKGRRIRGEVLREHLEKFDQRQSQTEIFSA
jgi:hypothetical protein